MNGLSCSISAPFIIPFPFKSQRTSYGGPPPALDPKRELNDSQSAPFTSWLSLKSGGHASGRGSSLTAEVAEHITFGSVPIVVSAARGATEVVSGYPSQSLSPAGTSQA